ncbi:MAG: hypothetical protein WCS12_01990 [Acholeplasmataceae bacterium]|jgi:hypothetical protein|nr:hypothetical protein [Acholeplasmataceae bacterium]MCK9234288.1 hypothetical protein [Acholeplasmataceae bacterium]MCK9289338.1 hypothetical protein [Acholeplasmataceae bacterium]MCK9427801.1 hypothetical protein [Acholeplasmataceae bacterium]MDD4090180.1 hypothetical protein [Acholeplasmataceae bacterium]
MPYFTIFKETLVQPFQLDKVERVFLENFLRFLEESQVGVIIEKSLKRYNNLGRPSYEPYRFFATIIHAFSKNKKGVTALF